MALTLSVLLISGIERGDVEPMPVCAVLFDKDGTLVDFEATWGEATLAVLRHLADGDADMYQRLVALARIDPASARFHPASPIIAGSAADFGPDWADTLGLPGGAAFFAEIDRLYRTYAGTSLTPIAGAIDAVKRLAAYGVPLGLATNDAEASARDHLDAFGILDRFAFVAGYDSGHGPKPQPGMVLAFAEHVGCRPSEVALLGDSLHDLHTARAAGALAVAVTTGLARVEDLAPHADIVAPDLATALRTLGW
jgi:phosphoglycolate phosphatase